MSVTVRALVEAQALPFFRIRLGSGRHWSPEWEQRRVDITACSVEVDGTGPRWEETTRWLPDGRLEVVVHFRGAPPRKGEELRLLFQAQWPGRVRPLMRSDQREPVVELVARDIDAGMAISVRLDLKRSLLPAPRH